MAGIYRTRPGADAVAPAVEGPAVSIGKDLWMSKGVSNSYAIDTDEGRVIINAGLPFEGHIRKRAFDAVCPGPTAALVFTQGHADHFSGYRPLTDDNTDIIMQENWRLWKTEHELLPSYRPRNTGFAFAHLAEAMIAGFSDLPEDERQVSFPEPTVEFRDQLELKIGGREIVLFSTFINLFLFIIIPRQTFPVCSFSCIYIFFLLTDIVFRFYHSYFTTTTTTTTIIIIFFLKGKKEN